MFALSVLDLILVVEGSTPADALKRSAHLAQQAEALGYQRYWVAEHHNMVGIAGAATAVVVGHIAAATKTLRVGSGGVMLPNHAPLVIAEQFGTLESLFPGRIDLGLGRAPGTDGMTLRALRRNPNLADQFPQDVLELQALLAPVEPNQLVQAVPGGGTNVPIWILGSSTFGAHLAAALGLPYAFAAHFAPGDLLPAMQIYRQQFKPSEQLDRPHAMVCINAIAADTTDQAKYLFTSLQQAFTNMVRGTRGKLQPPINDIEQYWSPMEKAHAAGMLTHSYVGTADTIAQDLQRLIDSTGADELMISSGIFDHDARVHSYEILGQVGARLVPAATPPLRRSA
jgi:luciferase family oxidoreductase group 1